MDITSRRRRALSTALALLLAIESVSAVAAAAQANVAMRDAPGASGAAQVASPPSGPASGAAGFVARTAYSLEGDPDAGLPKPRATFAPAVGTGATPAPRPTPRPTAIPKPPAPAVRPASPPKKSPPPPPATVSYRGQNHLWIPSLRIDRSVAWYACDRNRGPDNLVYRWGCAGANNVYLLGHAYSVFKPLHDAYVGHRLKVGMKAWYADGTGRVHAYAVTWWKITLPTPESRWAWAAQDVPSMTLQTCVGKDSEYRLMVRLVEVGG